MARTKSDNMQISISIPAGWKTELENPARIYFAEEGERVSYFLTCFVLKISDTISHYQIFYIHISGIKR